MLLFLKNLIFTLLIPGAVAVYFPLLIAHGERIAALPVLGVVGVIFLVIGAAIYFWTAWDFATFGNATPLPVDAPKRLVVRGLYRYVRNPMYLGVLLLILGWAAWFADGWLLLYALVVGAIVHLFVVRYEEPKLLQLFGEEYERYRKTVRRWVPRTRQNSE